MPCILGIIAPHPPLLHETIGKESREKLTDTLMALAQVEQDLYASSPDTIIVLSPHGADATRENSLSINLNSHYLTDFSEFGDFSEPKKFRSDVEIIHRVQHMGVPISTISDAKIGYSISLPLLHLTSKIKNVRIVPIYTSQGSYQEHYQFGQHLAHIVHETSKRVAVIASGDFSHKLTKEAPGGFSKNALKFDKKILQFLRTHQHEELSKFDPKIANDAGECGLRPILVLLGLFHDVNYRIDILSYEYPFGVGYAVAELK